MQRFVWLMLVAMLLALAAAPAAQAATAPGSVTPDTGTQGTRFVFLANGFAANERVGSWANTPDGRAIAYTTGALPNTLSDGSISWSWVAPVDIQPGTWQFVVQGISSGTVRVFTFGINPASSVAPSAAYNIQPASGRPGQIFGFYATGFTEGEAVNATVRMPDGSPFDATLTYDQAARAGGRVDGRWFSPADTTHYGTWQIVLRGAKSGVTVTIPATIAAPAAPPTPAPSVSPAVGRPGMTFLFKMSGFQPNELLSAWANVPNGTVLPIDSSVFQPAIRDVPKDWQWRAGDDGSVSFSWAVPADAVPGTWSLVVQGRTSGAAQVAAFQVIAGS